MVSSSRPRARVIRNPVIPSTPVIRDLSQTAMRTDRLGRHYNPHRQSPVAKAYNSEASRVEPVVLDRFGNVGEVSVNTETHQKVILSRSTITNVHAYIKSDNRISSQPSID